MSEGLYFKAILDGNHVSSLDGYIFVRPSVQLSSGLGTEYLPSRLTYLVWMAHRPIPIGGENLSQRLNSAGIKKWELDLLFTLVPSAVLDDWMRHKINWDPIYTLSVSSKAMISFEVWTTQAISQELWTNGLQ